MSHRPRGRGRRRYEGLGPKLAEVAGDCVRCPIPINRGDPIVPHREGWIHATCASGQDD